VTFLDGGTTLGIVPLVAGSAAFTTSTLTVGTHTIGATYSGSANFAASNAPSITEIIVAPQFTLTVSAPTSVVQAGQTATIPLTVSPVGGFSGPIQFSVAGLPPKTTFTFSPPVLTLGANPAIETLTIVTQASSNTVSGAVTAPSRMIFAGILWLPVAGLLLTGVGFARRRKGKGAAWIVLLVLFVGAGILAGCAGEPRFKFPGTPEGHFTLMVTATAVNSPGTAPQSTMVTLIVK
jgi:Bacterial Ig-like domain (group 3)